jgi:hypothetical protein
MKFIELATRCGRIEPSKIHTALPLTIMAALYWLSSLPGIPRPEDPGLYGVFYWVSPSIQNVLHVPAYAILAWSWHWALAAWVRSTRVQAMGAAIVTSLYGMTDEWHQSFVPGRFASLSDVALDFAGAALGIWLAIRMHRRLSNGSAAAGVTRTP